MELKLAEYKDGKFERFLELGSDFVFGGDFILFHNPEEFSYKNYLNDPSVINTTILASNHCQVKFFKDKKDPLNRFGGAFNGKTYGDGKFVLFKKLITSVEQWDYDFVARENPDPKEQNVFIRFDGLKCKIRNNWFYHDVAVHPYFFLDWVNSDEKVIGNIFENPELWEKVK